MDAGKQRAILFDMTRCSGCKECVAACMKKQGFEGDAKEVQDLSATAYTAVFEKDFDGDEYSYRNMCRHCVVPTCASVCPVGALEKTELGPVVYDADKCMGCRYCMTACPFGVPAYSYESAFEPKIVKCTFCHDRVKEGRIPACAEACPAGALTFGKRSDLIKLARRRIESQPERYLDHIYGEREVGGTSWMYLSGVPFGDLGFPTDLPNYPLIENTKGFLSAVPTVLVVWPALFGMCYSALKRREEVAGEEQKKENDLG